MLSITWISRNDDHGGNLIPRTQAALDALAEYRQQGLDVEVVFVEWNPPPNVPKLYDVLTWKIPVRWYEVPFEVHQGIQNWKKFGLRIHIGVNAGMRRTRGEWVLSTTPDCILSAGLARILAAETFQDDCFYRAPRFDAHADLAPGLTAAERIAHMEAHMIQRNVWRGGMFTKSCGDFILMSRARWHWLRGYVEWPVCPVWFDGIIMYMCAAGGMKQAVLSEPNYHMEHGERGLLRYKRLPYMPWKTYKRLAATMIKKHHAPKINHDGWGLRDLKEEQVADDRWVLRGKYIHPELRHWDELFA